MTIEALERNEPGAHYEAMPLRMRDEQGKMISPETRSRGERYGITPAIDKWVVETRRAGDLRSGRTRTPGAVLDQPLGQSLGDEQAPFVSDLIETSGIDPSKVFGLEITETAAIASFSQANRFEALKRLQVRARRFAPGCRRSVT